MRKNFALTPKGIIESLDAAPPYLPEDRCLRPLWPQRPGLYLGEDGQGRSSARRCKGCAGCRVKVARSNLLYACKEWASRLRCPFFIADVSAMS